MTFGGKKAQTKAKVVKETLEAVFESGDAPLLWHLDLAKTPAFTLSLRRREGGWDLGVETPEKPYASIVHFESYDAAEEALRIVQKAMMRRSGNLRVVTWVLASLLALIIGSFVYLAVSSSTPTQQQAAPAAQMQPSRSYAPVPALPRIRAEDVQSGVPQSADDLLKTEP